ncbi:MAG: hypothetical protein D6766_08275, partial [Verrucomicrobia bacterium]
AACRAASGADAVDMETAAIRSVCESRGVPCLTVRVISDGADEDLPLDFNRLMSPDGRLRWGRLAWALAARPIRVLELLRFHRRVKEAAERLAAVFDAALCGD